MFVFNLRFDKKQHTHHSEIAQWANDCEVL